MTPKELAHEFFLGIREAMTCPDVSVAEYEGVIAYKIDAAVKEATEAKEYELSLLRDLARQHEADRERAENYERLLTDIGKSIGCGHLDERLPSCVSEVIDAATDSRNTVLAIARELAEKCLRGKNACIACGAVGYMGGMTHNDGCAVLRLEAFK